ncbi:MAG: lysophospholipid acyltransferase family protein [Rhodobacteraceae bacterium]|nr:lysophospholipid acyltransferase family protein [Paracoccaceae bacterium]
MQKNVTRDISYASSASTRTGRAVIRLMENATGRLGLIRRVAGYQNEIAEGDNFWRVMARRFGLYLDIAGGSLDDLPRTGPLVVVANHPYGILDGLMMGHILDAVRGDFRIMAHRVFARAEAMERVILPINFDDTKAAIAENIAARAQALDYLRQGGAVGIFPGGTVSTAATPFATPADPVWRNFTAKLVTKSDALVVPIYFDGQNSRLFQLASHLNYTLRMGLLIREFRARIHQPVRIVIGKPIPRHALEARSGDATATMDFLRKATYDLSRKPRASFGYGYEFEEKYRARAGVSGAKDGGRDIRFGVGRAHSL